MSKKITVSFKRISRYGFIAEVDDDFEPGELNREELLQELQGRRIDDDEWIETYDELEVLRDTG